MYQRLIPVTKSLDDDSPSILISIGFEVFALKMSSLWFGAGAGSLALLGLVTVLPSAGGQSAGKTVPDAADTAFFETKVRPVLIEQCSACHGEKQQAGGLRLLRAPLRHRSGLSPARLTKRQPVRRDSHPLRATGGQT